MNSSLKQDCDGDAEEGMLNKDLRRIISSMRPQTLNLMNEFADAEMFLVDGDSLLMELALHESLDWKHTGQFLHLVYLFERYLHLFVRKDGVFQIVFFKKFDKVWKSVPAIYLARIVIMLHLLENVSYKIHLEFDNPWDPNFETYVKSFVPSFMLHSDGEILFARKDQELIPQKVYEIFILHLVKILSLGLNCAFSYGIEFGTSSLNGFHVMSSDSPSQFRKVDSISLKVRAQIYSIHQFPYNSDFARSPALVNDVLTKLKANLLMFGAACQDENGLVDCRLILHVATVIVYRQMFQADLAFQCDLIRVFLLHGVLLTQLPLKYRAFSLDDCNDVIPGLQHQLKQNLRNLQFIMAEVLHEFLQASDDDVLSVSMSAVCDVWDGRFLYKILCLLLTSNSSGCEYPLFDNSQRKFESLVHVVSSLSGNELKALPVLQYFSHYEKIESLNNKQTGKEVAAKKHSSEKNKFPVDQSRKDGLIQLECLLLNEYAGSILENTSVKKLDMNDPDVVSLVVSGNDFDETYHWHSGKPLSDDYDRTNDNNENYLDLNQRALMRSRDKYARYMQRYGESLQGEASSKTIVVEKTNKHAKKEKSKVGKKALAIREENKKKIEENKIKKNEESWLHEKSLVQQYEEQGRHEAAITILTRFLPVVTERKVKVEVLVTRAKICWKKWKESCTKRTQDQNDADILFLTIRELVENYKEDLTTRKKDRLGEYLHGLGLQDIVSKTNLTTKVFKDRDDYSLKTSSSRFQLQVLGHQLKRETRSDPDSRVDNFIPETWQRELLNAVDNKQPALIVAPTSSGKTFASYYCMERVLKEDNDGVVVYVSPTKALVNQVAATCYARYRKEMPPGKSVYGVFTRDYRQNALNCQILVTVPQCLEILLLSPTRQDWVARIKYVIFDEVHCIGSEIGAEVWEHLLLLIRSPFLALSATIRNPQILHQWLQSAEHDKYSRDKINNTLRPNSPKSYEVALVTHSERYNDLEKFNCIPSEENTPPVFEHIHPCSLLTLRQLKQSKTFPAHVSLSPREILTFHDALKDVFPETLLSPESFFKDDAFITKQRARSYENALKEELMSHVNNNNDEQVNTVLTKLAPGRPLQTRVTSTTLLNDIHSVVEELKENNQMPVIFFSYDRSLCEFFAEELTYSLQEKQEYLEEKYPEKFKRKVVIRKKDDQEDEPVQRKTKSAGHDESHQKTRRPAEPSCFLVDDSPPESCSYAGVGVLDAEDAQVVVERLRNNADEEIFREGLRRGVSYHHAGMSAKHRGVVEMLFRKKFVRVVFATGTLALGIHMPCKTVVFAGDSVFLNTLQYHQISGRAGRRGYDLRGNVVFFGIPQGKIQRLITENLPRIVGNFPLNISLVLRLLLLVSRAEDREIAMNQVLTLLQNPLICKNQPELDIQLKHHFLFSVELLVRQGLVDFKGQPQGLAGLATHLHYHEPSNFVLVAFLRDGFLHKFCRVGQKQSSKDFLKSLVILLSYLFARKKLHKMILRRPRSTSKVILEGLPHQFEAGIKKYNDKVHNVFDQYLRTVAEHVHNTLGEDVTLPLSGTKLISSAEYQVKLPAVLPTDRVEVETNEVKSPTSKDSLQSKEQIHSTTLDEKLQSSALSYKACSAFAALSGHSDDKLYNSKELFSNIRYQVYTDVKVVPTLDIDVELNAYAYDFFNHSNYKALIQENGLMHGDVHQLLKDFMLVLKSISVSLRELAPEDGDIVTRAFTQLAEEFESKFRDGFK